MNTFTRPSRPGGPGRTADRPAQADRRAPGFMAAVALMAGLAWSALSPGVLHAQSTVQRLGLLPLHAELRAGFATYGTGDDEGCGRGRAISLGIEARSEGPVIFSAAADMLFDVGLTCVNSLRTREFEGQTVGVYGRNGFQLDPRIAMNAGYAFDLSLFGGIFVEPTAGIGVQYTNTVFTDFQGGDDNAWRTWFGGTLTLRPHNQRLGAQVEFGRHRLLRRYCSTEPQPCIPGVGLVREFEIQDAFARFGFTWALG